MSEILTGVWDKT